MQVIYGNQGNDIIKKDAGIGLGNFDGLHLGHMALINTLINESKSLGINSIVYTFSKHPENILRKKLNTPIITTINKKIEILGGTELDYLYFDDFDEAFSRMKPEDFINDILYRKLKVKLAVSGYDYRFGYKGQGDVELLKEAGKEYGFNVIVIPPVKIEEETVSSTSIRRLIAKGNVEKASELLGRCFSISGTVKKGRRIGNTIGFPTANIAGPENIILPHTGVYITRTLIENSIYNSVTSVGVNPTFKENLPVSIETYIMDFNKDIYDKEIEVTFIKQLRNEKNFGSVDELVRQIKNDVSVARLYFESQKNDY
ncbi:MAG TPA: bifunctional riboflavin kinase/FAD synthetase [Pseudobacteroides sp.]|uniref:bifunctional riboflavin kinase/FAD synthetase n=1 Tax=Pseudobacteroides sp. TaxID=1968840 RepID=UPI002F94320D